MASSYQMYLSRTDWFVVTMGYGFMVMFLMFAFMFGHMNKLEMKFDHLTKALSDTFIQLAKVEKQNHERYGHASNITVTFKNNGLGLDTAFDFMSLEDLEKERRKAEKEENYEKAAIIQKKIDQRKRL